MTLTFAQLAQFSLGAVLIILLPGPNSLFVATSAAQVSRRAGDGRDHEDAAADEHTGGGLPAGASRHLRGARRDEQRVRPGQQDWL